MLKRCPRALDLSARLLPWLLACLLPATAQADLWVSGYYPGYEWWSMSPANIDFTTITHVIHFALGPQSTGAIDTTTDSLSLSTAQVVGLAHAAGRKALICVSGSDTPGFMGATTPANIGLFITNIVSFMSTNGYDGVDLDWEPIATGDYIQYSNLVCGLRASLNTFGTHKLLTMAATSSSSQTPSIYSYTATLQGYFDQINIMTYSMSGNWPGWITWYTSPIYDGGNTFPCCKSELVPSIRASVSNYISGGVLAGKLGIGIPYYASVWTGVAGGLTGPLQTWPTTNVPAVDLANYSVVMSSYYQSDRYHWDSVAQAAYLSITNTPASNDMFVSYDDTHACQDKVSYARNLGLGGVMLWELENEYMPSQPAGQRTPLTSAVKQALATPQFSAVQCNGTNITLSFTSAPLGLYCVQWSSNLVPGTWNTLSNNVAGTGSNVLVTDPAPATLPGRFYRIQTP